MKNLQLPEGTKVPNHVVIIPDGDRRWARARGKSASEGHRAGIDNLVTLAKCARNWGVHTVSSWGLSTENWLERPKEEVDFLMKGIAMAIDQYMETFEKERVRFVHLGRKDRLPQFLLDKIAQAEKSTKDYEKHVFNVGLDYNGWDEIVRASQKIVQSGVEAEKIDRKLIEKNLDTWDQPYPYIDLFIRTGGEQRTSGFMMWQADYAEFYWEVDHFPAFTPEKLREAILDYSRRRRRFGGNDAEEHLKFDPAIIAGLDIQMQKRVDVETIKKYVKEQYGLTKELALEAGGHLYSAWRYREKQEWYQAKEALRKLYVLVRKNLGLAFEPEIVANFEIKFWQSPSEENMRELLAEKFRVSTFQASKSAHLAVLADNEVRKGNWEKAKGLFEKYYLALKERVA